MPTVRLPPLDRGEAMDKLDVLCVTLLNLNILVKPVDRGIFDRDATLVSDYNVVVGGDGTNQAVTLSCLGHSVGVCGSIGDDQFGRLTMQLLRDRAIDTAQVSIDPQSQTAICLVMIGSDGERNFIVKRGACDRFTLADIDQALCTRAKILNIGSLFTFKKLYGGDLATLLRNAQQKGLLTSADAMYDSYGIGAENMLDVLPYLDYFLPSYGEAKYLTQEDDPVRMADKLLSCGVKNIVIKLGASGCLLKNARIQMLQPAFRVPVVDTTGAGDNFIAGFLHGVLNGWDERRCLLTASAAASISIGSIGATGAVQSAEQIQQWLWEKQKIKL